MPSSARKLSLLVAAIMVALSGCSLNPMPAPAPPASTTTPPPPPDSVVGAPVPVLPPDTVPGARPFSIAVDGPAAVRANWSYISGADAYNAALDQQLLGLLDENAGGHFKPTVPDPAKPAFSNGLELQQDIIVTNTAILGTRFTTSRAVNGVVSPVSITTSYQDLSTGSQIGGKDLVSPESVDALRSLLVEAVRANPSTSPTSTAPASPTASPAASSTSTADATNASPAPATVPSEAAPATPPTADALLSGAAFDSHGELVVPLLADPATGSPLPEPLTVHITKSAAEPLLNEHGTQLRQLLLSPAPLTPPPASPPALDHINCDIVPCAALTYDDGPNAETTRLLKILADRSLYATFFEQGIYAASNPAISAATAAAGHVIGNHTVHHPDLSKLSLGAALGEIKGATDMISNASGVTPQMLRPPYGAMTHRVAAGAGMPIVNWSVDSLDWQSRNQDVFIPKIMSLVRPGAIILQHDVHKTTVDGQVRLIDALQGAGYRLVTVPQLFQGIPMTNGQSYFCRGETYPCTPGR